MADGTSGKAPPLARPGASIHAWGRLLQHCNIDGIVTFERPNLRQVQVVLGNMKEHKVESEIVRLADKNIPVGLGFRESPDDEWPEIVSKIKSSDIIIFATPITRDMSIYLFCTFVR